jgi:hypothetical protein
MYLFLLKLACVCVAKVLHEVYFLFAAPRFGIMHLGYCIFRKIREIRTQDNGIRNIGISRKCPFQDNGIRVIEFGKLSDKVKKAN